MNQFDLETIDQSALVLMKYKAIKFDDDSEALCVVCGRMRCGGNEVVGDQ
jgi:hypothetical protein